MPNPDRHRIAAALAALALVAVPTGAKTHPAVSQVDRATAQLFAPDASPARIQAGLQSLLAAITETASGLSLPGEFTDKLAQARRGQAADAKIPSLLQECYRLVHRGTPYHLPDSIHDMPGAMDYMRSRIAAGRELLLKGQAEEGLRALLDAAVLMVTPFHAGEPPAR